MKKCEDCIFDDWCGYDLGEKVCEKFMDATRIVELPCKPGDTVYYIQTSFSFLKEPQKYIVKDIYLSFNYNTLFKVFLPDSINTIRTFTNEHIGKAVFLTKEAAEKALKERQM